MDDGGALGLVFAMILAAPPVVSLGAPHPAGCAPSVVVDGQRLAGGPTALCIREAVGLVLEGTPMVAMRVDAPHRFDARVRSRVFLYRIVSGRLVPRFLGSGFASREVTHLVPLEGALGVETVDAGGVHATLRCVFDGFPLVCAATPP